MCARVSDFASVGDRDASRTEHACCVHHDLVIIFNQRRPDFAGACVSRSVWYTRSTKASVHVVERDTRRSMTVTKRRVKAESAEGTGKQFMWFRIIYCWTDGLFHSSATEPGKHINT